MQLTDSTNGASDCQVLRFAQDDRAVELYTGN